MLGIVQLEICLSLRVLLVYDVSITWSRDVVQDADTEFRFSVLCRSRRARGHVYNVFNALSLVSAGRAGAAGETTRRAVCKLH